MKRHRSRTNPAGRTAGARWLAAIICLCVGLGAGFACLISLAQNWGATPTLTYALICILAFVVGGMIARRAAATHV